AEGTSTRAVRPAANLLKQCIERLRLPLLARKLTDASPISLGALIGQPSFEVMHQSGKIGILPVGFREEIDEETALDTVLEAPAVGFDIRLPLVPIRLDGHFHAGFLRRVECHILEWPRIVDAELPPGGGVFGRLEALAPLIDVKQVEVLDIEDDGHDPQAFAA